MTRPKLADITQRAAAATEGPWEAGDVYGLVAPTQIDGFVYPLRRAAAIERTATDAAFIAHARADVPALSAAIRDVLALHTPETPRRDPDFHHTDRVCIECGDLFPCRTYSAVTAHIDTTPKETP